VDVLINNYTYVIICPLLVEKKWRIPRAVSLLNADPQVVVRD
jgi:hypothetical protein